MIEQTRAELDQETDGEPPVHSDTLKFLGLVKHELKTPMHAILGFSRLIESQAGGPIENPLYLDWAKEIRTSGESLLRLIEELLASASAETTGAELAESHIDFKVLLADVAADLRYAAGLKEIDVSSAVAHDVAGMWGDEQVVRQALAAVTDNALKFTPQGGAVQVGVEMSAEGDIVVYVEDTGPGFKDPNDKSLLAPFTQGEASLAREYEGAGIGLFLCKQQMEMLDGRVELDNRPSGGGCVRLVFPASRALNTPADWDLTMMDDGDADADAQPNVILELEADGQTTKLFPGAGQIVFGRPGAQASSTEADILFEDRRVSRLHAVIAWHDGAFHLIDDSKRGSYVAPNGEAPQFVHLNVSAALEGEGVIALGASPDESDVAQVRYRLRVVTAEAA